MSGTRYAGHLPWAETRRVARLLREARKTSGMTQKDTAAALSWSLGTVQASLAAVTRMRAADALALARAFGADPAELGLGGEGKC